MQILLDHEAAAVFFSILNVFFLLLNCGVITVLISVQALRAASDISVNDHYRLKHAKQLSWFGRELSTSQRL